MSDARLDALAETARNRGLKLVRSRVRTPGKRRFGKSGLTDASGKGVFGMDAKGPTARPEEVEEFLRNLGAKDWGASLDGAEPPKKRKPRKAKPAAKRAPAPKPKPAPNPQLRPARPADADAVAALIRLLGHDVDDKGVRKRIAMLAKENLAPLVATLNKQVIGLCGMHRMAVIHRDRPVGRITILVVAEPARGEGIGRILIEAAEGHLASLGCRLIEVTSNDALGAAHAFYRHLGYERTGIRFAKRL